jgi:HEAT repeat protein
VLEEALGEAEERIRIAAARGLGEIGPPAAAALERAVHDPVRGVREAAALGLGSAWQSRPLEELANRLATDDDADIRYAAALALARRANDKDAGQIIPRLEALAKSGTPATRLAARLTRAYLGHPAEMAEFLRILRDGM